MKNGLNWNIWFQSRVEILDNFLDSDRYLTNLYWIFENQDKILINKKNSIFSKFLYNVLQKIKNIKS